VTRITVAGVEGHKRRNEFGSGIGVSSAKCAGRWPDAPRLTTRLEQNSTFFSDGPGFRQEANIPDAGCGFWHVSNCRATALRNRWRCPDRCDTVSYIQSPLDLDRSLPFLKNAEASDCLLRSHVRHVDSSASLARIVRSSARIRAVEVEMDVFDIPLELLQLVGGKPPFAAIHWER